MSQLLKNIASAANAQLAAGKNLQHEKYFSSLTNYIGDDEKRVIYQPGEKAILCPEPLYLLNEFFDISNSQELCVEKFRTMIAGFPTVALNQAPMDGSWYHSSLKGINLRPGFKDGDPTAPTAVQMGDKAVHGVVVGRTGSGKSVFLNNLICNLMGEYSPWELSLYLADFKKVELSRYLSNNNTPHIKAVAATSELRYVISMISHLVNCMQARQDFFARLGVQKLSDFREQFGVMLPRVLLIVDEFQQMYLSATNRESAQLQELLTSITKLGRATGFHLLFASQEMSGALSGNDLANFKIRFALPCESEVSSAILGNTGAATLEIGSVYVNTESGAEEDNILYQVPFIESAKMDKGEKPYFYKYLDNQEKKAAQFCYESYGKLYQEDYIQKMSELQKILLRIKETRKSMLARSGGQYFDICTLGPAVVYSTRKNDLETFFIERGVNKNVLMVSPEVDDIAYMQRLLAENFAYSPLTDEIGGVQHIVFALNPIVTAKYDICQTLQNTMTFHDIDDLERVYKLYCERCAASKAMNLSNSASDFLNRYFQELGRLENEDYSKQAEYASSLFANVSDKELPDACERLMITDPVVRYFQEPLIIYYDRKVNGLTQQDCFCPFVVWLNGIEIMDRMPRYLMDLMKNGLSVNMLFLSFAANEPSVMYEFMSTADYLFVSGTNEKIYDRMGINYTNKTKNTIVIDFKIKSLNTTRSFKKYLFKLNECIVPAIDFDAIL